MTHTRTTPAWRWRDWIVIALLVLLVTWGVLGWVGLVTVIRWVF